ncbi:acetylornithine deacetylase/succinyl-diaminopimelate desuccinylase-like protein [Actinomadura algeriensis]|uniref:Acetylornithine deacetylase/succinyl-diaminopimelate desuccinylase-like protein n=1 Tax=Actinomadura algeriensis TaxID=1679523 RepID=A0ABR9K4T4_9ACTN|nr:acetylornithine deacetylase/succinyl-diaminopimelate desuccinylase-like protein [Actinomadura algeriensis]
MWPVGRLAEMPYTDDGTTITGPGVLDMKGGLVVLETALRALDAAGVAVRVPVRAVVVADEEVGSPTGRAVAALGQDVRGRPAAGSGDANLPGSRGLPTLDGLGPRGRGAQAPDEHVLVASLTERAALLAALIASSGQE